MPEKLLSVSSMTLREKIGQLFIMGFKGHDISEDSSVLEMIKTDKPGGVILFDKDMIGNKPVHNIKSPEQLSELTSALQGAADIPLFISTDQEGGLIRRLKPEYGFPENKSHQKLGEIDETDITQQESELIAKTLSENGINLNFAPVVDLTLNKKSSIIAKRERSFGSDPDKVIKHARGYINGHLPSKVITCCKHFPGHGSAEGDTHAGFVDVTDTWIEDELQPYKTLIGENKCPMIMTAHIFNEHFDQKMPATLSKYVLTDLLRKQLQFEGVVISDDMQMRAISDHYDLQESLRLGLNAGLDMFCFGNNLLKDQIHLEDAILSVKHLVENGDITEKRINQSVDRILKLKEEYLV
jgi:beta-N-acetylhexosaminidase